VPVSPVPVSPSPSNPADAPVTPEPTDPSAPPVATPEPTVRPTPKPTPRPTPVTFTRAERYLVDGIMRGDGDCLPVRGGRLPGDAIAGIDCDLVGTPVARMGFYLFRTESDMLDAYIARLTAERLEIEGGDGCFEREGDNAYVPWDEADGLGPYRQACFVNSEGYGNLRLTMPGPHVYVGLLGRTAAMRPLSDWAFFGNQDTPSYPTLWVPPYEL
jgi:hypothetical protein